MFAPSCWGDPEAVGVTYMIDPLMSKRQPKLSLDGFQLIQSSCGLQGSN